MTSRQIKYFAKNCTQAQRRQFNVIMEQVGLFVKILYVIAFIFVHKINVRM